MTVPTTETSEPTRRDPVTVTSAVLRGWALPPAGDDKHARGTVLVAGGAARSPGAVLLAGLAALRVGAGKVQLAVAEPAAAALSVAVPEALVVPLPCDPGTGSVEPDAAATLADLLPSCDAVCLGPGLDDARRTGALVPAVLARLDPGSRVVLDAYALGALAEHPECAAGLAGRCVLTPNAGEAGVLLGAGSPEGDELGDAADRIADRYAAVVTLRGRTTDAAGGRWQDGAGLPGLGTSGSGDVLAGLVAGLLARGASPAQAAVWGTHLHATAGERLSARVGPLGFLARELLDEIPRLLVELQ